MVGKRSGKALLREEGKLCLLTTPWILLTVFPRSGENRQQYGPDYVAADQHDQSEELLHVCACPLKNILLVHSANVGIANMCINHGNFCFSEYLKRDDQILPLRLLQEERRNRMMAKARDKDRNLNQETEPQASGADLDLDDDVGDDAEAPLPGGDALGSKVIVIHPGSQNLRIGLANDALPKTVPMVIARRSDESEYEEDGGEPNPKRRKLENGIHMEPEKMFGEDFASQYAKMCADLKVHMRANKRRVLPNSKELIVNYNKRQPPETIREHNDPHRIDWTEFPADAKDAPVFFTGKDALRISDDSKPRYKLFWPLQHGWYNEKEYTARSDIYNDISTIIEEALKRELSLRRKRDWAQYGCIFVVPDLYEKRYVVQALDMLMREFGFAKVAFIQESLAATFGAGYSQACIVDIGAQKTSICCVEEGMCIENSRINLKYGGADVTETFIRMMLYDHFPYQDINLRRRFDFLLAEELKMKFCTMNENDISPQLYEFHLRASGQDTRKYFFKTYDEVLLAPQGYFQPGLFDNSHKLDGRRKLIEPSMDIYEGGPNDPVSSAQSAVIALIAPTAPTELAVNGESSSGTLATAVSKPAPSALPKLNDMDRASVSAAGTPAPEDDDAPMQTGEASAAEVLATSIRDDVLPVIPLDTAILTSITHGARSDERRTRDFLGSVMVIGGGSQFQGFYAFLEERLKEVRPGFAKDILIGTAPRELDPQVLVWKGGSVFGRLRGTNDSWIGRTEYDRLGARVLPYKCMWSW